MLSTLLLVMNLSGSSLSLLEGDGRDPVYTPLGAGETCDLRVQLVDLLEGQTLCLVDIKVDKRDAEETAGEPDEKDLGLEVGITITVVDKIRGGVSDGPV